MSRMIGEACIWGDWSGTTKGSKGKSPCGGEEGVSVPRSRPSPVPERPDEISEVSGRRPPLGRQ